MTIEEMLAREAIRETLADYNMSGDRMAIEDFTDCFTDDAIFRSDLFDLKGKDAIRAWLRSMAAAPSEARFVRHNLTTCQIRLCGADEARVRTYFFVVSNNGPDHGGYYSDRFRRVGDRWLIAERKVRVDWASADTLLVRNEDAG